MNPTELMIRNAHPEDAMEILNLNKISFPKNYLIYSVYQSDKSQQHLEKIIIKQRRKHNDEIIRVFIDNDLLLGYYMAKPINNCFFLNYIATKKGYERQRIGGFLLNDYHNIGKALGLNKFLLDVYSSNDVAYNWYNKNGYKEEMEFYNLCFNDIEIKYSLNQKSLLFQKEEILAKLYEESENGFSKIKISTSAFDFEIMLIAGIILRYQNLINITVDEALEYSLLFDFGPRNYHLFIGEQQYKGKRNLLFSEKVIRMSKYIE